MHTNKIYVHLPSFYILIESFLTPMNLHTRMDYSIAYKYLERITRLQGARSTLAW